jgi:hypothetical protein
MNARIAIVSRNLLAISLVISLPAVAAAQGGSIVGWGRQVVGVDLGAGFVAVAAGRRRGLDTKSDNSIAAWGTDGNGIVSVLGLPEVLAMSGPGMQIAGECAPASVTGAMT